MSDDAKKNATSTNHIEPSTLITPKPPRKRRWTKGEKRFAKVARVVQSPSLSAPKTAELTCTANTTPTATKVSTTEVSISTLSATASVSVSAATVSVQQPSQHSTSSALITQTSHLDTTAKLTQPQPQPQPNENENVSNVSSKKKRKKKKKKIVLPIPSIDQLIQCAKNAQYTKSVYICDGTPTPPTTNEEFIRHQEGRRRNQKFNLMACTSSGVEDVIVSTSSFPQNELSSWVLLNATRTTTTKHHSGGGGGGGGENQTHTTTTADQSTSPFGLVTTHDGGGVRKQGGGNTNTDEMRHSTTKTQQHARPQSQQLLLRQPLNPQKRIIHIHLQPLLILDLNGILCHRIRQEPNTTCVATTTTTHHHQQQQQQQNTTFNSSNNHNTQRYRPSCGRIAYTDVVARPNVKSWLCYLDHYFTLAVWTSATKKTAKALVKMIFPPNVESKLLFIWAQNRCNCILAPSNTTKGNENTNTSSSCYNTANSNNTANQKQPHGGDEQQSTEEALAVAKDPNQLNTTFNNNTVKKKKLDHSETLFVKCLSKVWKEFPLWDQTNTILIDDTPEKCRSFESNTLHPPPMNGLLPNRNELECLDEKNEQEQSIFFQALVNYYWKQQQHNQQHEGQQPRELTRMLPHDDQEIHQHLDNESIANGCPTNADNNYNSLVQFLHKHGSGHMGWRG